VKLKDPQNTKKDDYTNIRLNQNDYNSVGNSKNPNSTGCCG